MLANLIPGWSWSFSSPTLGRIARVLILLALWTYVSGVAGLSAVLSTMPCVVAQAIPRPHQREARVLCAATCLTWSSSGISRPRLGKARRHRSLLRGVACWSLRLLASPHVLSASSAACSQPFHCKYRRHIIEPFKVQSTQASVEVPGCRLQDASALVSVGEPSKGQPVQV